MAEQRIANITRNTKETQIELELNVDGTGVSEIDTGIPFFDHMLTLFAKHGLFDLKVKATGDIDVDYHHMVEDTGIVLGQAVKQALGDKGGIRRYGFFLLPMDESLARVVLDLSNRQAFVYNVDYQFPMVRDFSIVLVKEFFQAFANDAACNLHITLEYGKSRTTLPKPSSKASHVRSTWLPRWIPVSAVHCRPPRARSRCS